MAISAFKKIAMKAPGAVDHSINPFAEGVQSSSPSVNFIFGNTHKFPKGAVAVTYGLPKSGKSLLLNDMIAQLHKDDPEAIALKWNTEWRETFQMTPDQLKRWGVDIDRYQAYETQDPSEIFDTICTLVPQLVKDGYKIGLVGIDSVSNILGRNLLAADSVDQQLRGDQAKTIQDGLSRCISVFRKLRIPLVMTAQVRAEQDPNKAKFNPYTMAGGYYLKHSAEYFIKISKANDTKAGDKEDMDGNKFELDLKDLDGGKEATGHKIKVEMTGNSCGPAGRTAKFTVDYSKGIINQHEEIFLLGYNRRIIARPNQKVYTFDGVKWNGIKEAVTAIRDSTELQSKIIRELRRQDIEKDYPALAPTEKSLEELLEEEGG